MLLLLLRLLLILILILILLVLLLVLLLLLFLLHATAEGAGIVFLRFSAAKNSKKTIPARNCTHLTLSPNCQRELPPALAAGGDQDEPDDSDESRRGRAGRRACSGPSGERPLASLALKIVIHPTEKGIVPGKRPGAVSSPVPRMKCISRVVKISSASVNFPSRRKG